jgi:hypothetical protein
MDQHKKDQGPRSGAGTERNEEEVGRPVELPEEDDTKEKQGRKLPRDPGAGETVPAK